MWTYETIAGAVHSRLEGSLQALLASDVSALGQWLDGQAALADVMAGDPRVRGDVAELLALSRRTAGDPAALKALTPVVSRQDNAGFFIDDPGGLIVARIVDERVGDRVTLGVADAASHSLAGRRAFLPPTLKQRFAAGPMACLLVPVRESSGQVNAALAWRIRPELMAALLNASRLGETGETYAVDAEGRMVTESRFAEKVATLGLLPSAAGGKTTAVLEVRDPGVRLVEGMAPKTPPKTWPLTWAVAEAVAGRAGVHASGYRNYRGVQVVGAKGKA